MSAFVKKFVVILTLGAAISGCTAHCDCPPQTQAPAPVVHVHTD